MVSAHSTPSTISRWRPIGSVGQRDRALGDGASVGQVAPHAIGGLDRPFGDVAVFAHDPRVASRRGVSRKGATSGSIERAARARRAGGARCVSSTSRVRLSRAWASLATSRPSAVEKRDLGLRRDDRALAADVPPFARRSRPRSRACRSSRRRARPESKAAARGRRFGENERGARSKADAVGEREPALGRLGIMRVDEDAPRHAGARRRQANFRVVACERFIATATRSTPSPCGAAKTATKTAPSGSFHPLCVIGPSASRHSTSGSPLASNGDAGQESVARQRGIGAASRDEARGEGDQRGVGGAPVDRARRVVLGVGVVVAALAEAELRAHG